jgi:hypothetical protein
VAVFTPKQPVPVGEQPEVARTLGENLGPAYLSGPAVWAAVSKAAVIPRQVVTGGRLEPGLGRPGEREIQSTGAGGFQNYLHNLDTIWRF